MFALRTEAGQCVVVRGEKIVPSSSAVSLSMDLGAGELRAGLINSHDHLFLNQFPRLGSPPYRSMYAWADDIHHRFAVEVDRYSRLPRGDALLFGALKNLLGGVTTVVHHDPWSEHLDSGFPLRVERVRVIHSLGFESDLEGALAGSEDMKGRPVCMHLAEGVGDDAASEVHEAAARGLMNGHLMAVHLVTVDGPGIELLRAAHAAFVWCPTSNLFLYGRTSPPELFESGIDVLLGTDSLLSGAGTLLDELRTAHEVGRLDEDRLVGAVGGASARAPRADPRAWRRRGCRLPPPTAPRGAPPRRGPRPRGREAPPGRRRVRRALRTHGCAGRATRGRGRAEARRRAAGHGCEGGRGSLSELWSYPELVRAVGWALHGPRGHWHRARRAGRMVTVRDLPGTPGGGCGRWCRVPCCRFEAPA